MRSLQLLLIQHDWDETGLVDAMQRRIARNHLPAPDEPRDEALGLLAWVDETSHLKKGDKTPSVQRQYCGCVGKMENSIVTLHLAMACGRFTAIVDSGL